MDGHYVSGVINWKAEWASGSGVTIKIESAGRSYKFIADYNEIVPDLDFKHGIPEKDFQYFVEKFLEHTIHHYNGCSENENLDL